MSLVTTPTGLPPPAPFYAIKRAGPALTSPDGAEPLFEGWNLIGAGVVTATNDAFILPPAKPGVSLYVDMPGGLDGNVFAVAGDKINDDGSGSPVTAWSGNAVLFVCARPREWKMFHSGTG